MQNNTNRAANAIASGNTPIGTMLPDIKTETILNSLAEGVITIDKEFRITFINDSASRLTGFHKNEVIGKICKKVFGAASCLDNCPIARVLVSGKNIFDYDSSIICKGSDHIPIKLNAAVMLDETGEAMGGVLTFRDMTLIRNLKGIIDKEFIFHGMISQSSVMRDLFSLIEQITNSDAPVFITGETGTGKELIANAIHALSKRNKNNFIKFNCSVIPENLLGSELFGHSKGAFTDAQKDRIGRFELADGGTIFLDEIGEMPVYMQPQILRVLQDGSFERIGESVTRKVDVRIIAATNLNIQSAIANGGFRKDLYYRLNNIHIHLPPLRERKEDLPLLADYFLKKYCSLYDKNIPGFDDECMAYLLQYKWEGNIRELENAIEYAVIRSKPGSNLYVCCLPVAIRQDNTNCGHPQNNSLDYFEGTSLLNLLHKHKWNKTEVAKELGVDRTTLWRRLKYLGIK